MVHFVSGIHFKQQCVYNAIASMVFNETQPVNEWTCQHLDKIMKLGDWLYTNLQRDNSDPLISDIPKKHLARLYPQ